MTQGRRHLAHLPTCPPAHQPDACRTRCSQVMPGAGLLPAHLTHGATGPTRRCRWSHLQYSSPTALQPYSPTGLQASYTQPQPTAYIPPGLEPVSAVLVRPNPRPVACVWSGVRGERCHRACMATTSPPHHLTTSPLERVVVALNELFSLALPYLSFSISGWVCFLDLFLFQRFLLGKVHFSGTNIKNMPF